MEKLDLNFVSFNNFDNDISDLLQHNFDYFGNPENGDVIISSSQMGIINYLLSDEDDELGFEESLFISRLKDEFENGADYIIVFNY